MLNDIQFRATVDEADAIVHLGAGRCSELPLYLSGARDRRIVLVEADPEMARSLARRNANRSNVEILSCAVAGGAGENTLHVYNMRELSSLRQPTGLLEFYPGLRVVHEVPVETIPSNQLVSDIDIRGCESPLLVIDVPGEEFSILRNLRDVGRLGCFPHLVVRCPTRCLYAGAGSADEVLALLGDQGFERLAVLDDGDPDRPVWLFRFSSWKLECDDVRQRNRELAEQVEQIQRDVEARTAELQAAQNDLSVALRLQMLREADLKDLQTRYSAVLSMKERQDELLAKLRARLGVASEYLKRMDLKGGEHPGDGSAPDPIRTLAGKDR